MSSCLGKVCTVQHRNPDCRGGKHAKEIDALRAQVKDLHEDVEERDISIGNETKLRLAAEDSLRNGLNRHKAKYKELQVEFEETRECHAMECEVRIGIEAENEHLKKLAGKLGRDVLQDLANEIAAENKNLQSYVEIMESKCDRYQRERNEDRVDYAKTYQERDELKTRLKGLAIPICDYCDGCGVKYSGVDDAVQCPDCAGSGSPEIARLLAKIEAKDRLLNEWLQVTGDNHEDMDWDDYEERIISNLKEIEGNL